MIKVGVVVPTYKKDLFQRFVDKWDWTCEAYDITLYFVQDQPKPFIEDIFKNNKVKTYCWEDIDNDLGKDSWIISRRSSSIRSYGYLKAYQDGMDYVLTLDDDCYPVDDMSIEDLIEAHLFALDFEEDYSNTFNVGGFLFPGKYLWMRGSPIRYRKPREAVVSIGGWDNNPDLDAWTQLEHQAPKLVCNRDYTYVPKYSGITMCGMNIMFKRETIPIAYFLLQGERWGVDRVDDIWAGLFMKKVLDHFDLPMAINGYASVFHDRASNAMDSLKKEGLTLQETELLWDRLSSINIEGDTLISAYKYMVSKCNPEWFGMQLSGVGTNKFDNYYGVHLKEAMNVWACLFDGME